MLENQKICIRQLTDEKQGEWNSFVRNSSNGTFFHLSGWRKVLEKTFGYKPCYIYVESEGKICGVLPLFLIKNLLSGRALVSLPFGVYGGICADDKEAALALFEEAKKITRNEKVGYLELRNQYPFNGELPTKDLYYTFIKELPKKKEDCLQQLPRKARAAARKGISFGLEVKVGIEFLKEFYEVYAVSVRNLGSPVFPFSFLKNLVCEFKDNTTVLTIRYKNRPVAAVFTFLFKDTVLPYYGGSLARYFKYQPNNFMYLKLMEYGAENRYRYFDYGRSKKGSGSYDFKEFQGFIPQPLYYQYFLNTISSVPDVASTNPKLNLVVNIWKRLPVWVTKVIGPRIIGLTPP